jgi:1-acyl-sn-glycerol-3-phosphate acyltransferase
VSSVLDQRDRRFVRGVPAVATAMTAYFRPTVRGLDRVPAEGPVLLAGNHSGGILMPDVMALFGAWIRRFGIDRPLRPLGFDLPFAIPGFGALLPKLGAIPACPANAEAALGRGDSVLVYPGGDRDDFRPWRDRHRIDLDHRTGFVRLALRTGVPLVPVVSHGSHESLVVLSRGDRIAAALRLDRLMRVKIFPVVVGWPLGIAPGWLPYVPLPAKVTVEVQPPIDFRARGLERDHAEDPDVVDACYREVEAVMQHALDRLARHPALPLLDPPGRAHAVSSPTAPASR